MITRYVCAVMRGRIHLYIRGFATEINFTRMAFRREMHNFAQIMFYFCCILLKNAKKCKKMQKNVRKICIYQKFVVILHRHLKKR